jgi:hypothetical protein
LQRREILCRRASREKEIFMDARGFRRYPVMILVTAALGLSACAQHVSAPEEEYLVDASTIRGVLAVDQIDYDTLRLYSTQKIYIPSESPQISRIHAGTQSTSGFQELFWVAPTRTVETGGWEYSFDVHMAMDPTKVTLPVRLRFEFSDQTFEDVDTLMPTYLYPYLSAEAFLTEAVLIGGNPISFQDIDRNSTTLFFHPVGPYGLYAFDILSRQTRMLADYPAGDYITTDSGYVFYENSGSYLYRYNLQTDTTDLTIPFIAPPKVIHGMAARGGTLYIYYAPETGTPTFLARLTLSGALLDTIPYSPSGGNGYYLATDGTIVYSRDFEGRKISRFELATQTFLSDVQSPNISLDGFAVFADRLYFTDYAKRMIGVVPIGDLSH